MLAIIIVPRNRRPTSATAWLLAIYFIPLIGVFLFLLIGNPRLPRKRRRKQERINEYIHDTSAHLDFGTLRPHAPEWFTSLVTLNRNLGAMPLAGDNGAHLIPDYQESLDAMADAIRAAERYVHVEFYILQADASTDNFFRALEEAAARGVTVRVLLDHWANRGKPFYRKTLKRLDAMGAQWQLMLPVQPFKGKYQRPDLRNHRKLLVVDGTVAFMGSQNVTDSTYNLRKNIRRGLHWVDLMVRVQGPVVASINAVFLSDWYSETDEVLTDDINLFAVETGPGDLDCQIIPSGPGFEFENNLRLFLGLLYYAQKKIIIVSPYFVPDEALLNADHDSVPSRARGRAVRLGGGRPGSRLPRAAQLLRGAAEGRRQDLDVPEALHPALQVDDDRRRDRDHRVEQHGHALVRSQHGDLDARPRRRVRPRDARRSSSAIATSAASSRSRSGRSSRCAPRCSTTSRASPRLFSEFAAPRDARRDRTSVEARRRHAMMEAVGSCGRTPDCGIRRRKA